METARDPFFLTFDEATGQWFVNDERNGNWIFDCCTSSHEVAKQYRDEFNATATGA